MVYPELMTTSRSAFLAASAATVAVLAARARPAAAATDRAVLAGGCFWGMEAVFERLRGVTSVVAGYAGGTDPHPTYELVGTGTSGYAESVEVRFDPARIAYERLLDVFFTVAHDPTQRDRQGPDVGPQYRSAIFYASAEQRAAAERAVRALAARRAFGGAPIVTEIVPLRGFVAAEAYHQHYYDRHPDDPYIVVNDVPKVAALRRRYPQLVAG